MFVKQAVYDAKVKEAEQLADQVQQLTSANASLTEELNTLKADLSAAKETQELQPSAVELAEKIAEQNDTISTLESENAELRSRVEALSKQTPPPAAPVKGNEGKDETTWDRAQRLAQLV